MMMANAAIRCQAVPRRLTGGRRHPCKSSRPQSWMRNPVDSRQSLPRRRRCASHVPTARRDRHGRPDATVACRLPLGESRGAPGREEGRNGASPRNRPSWNRQGSSWSNFRLHSSPKPRARGSSQPVPCQQPLCSCLILTQRSPRNLIWPRRLAYVRHKCRAMLLLVELRGG